MDSARQLKRNQHRVLAAYLSMYCWLERLDCLIVSRGFLEKTLGLERFKGTRINEIREDFEGFFNYCVDIKYEYIRKFAEIVISRDSLKDLGGNMTSRDRAGFLTTNGTMTRVISQSQDYGSLSFDKLASKMMSISAGLIPPTEIPKLRFD